MNARAISNYRDSRAAYLGSMNMRAYAETLATTPDLDVEKQKAFTTSSFPKHRVFRDSLTSYLTSAKWKLVRLRSLGTRPTSNA